jgi:hypothetical protein
MFLAVLCSLNLPAHKAGVDALVLDENNMPHIEVDHTVAPITTDITAFERGSPYFLEVFQLSLTLTHF